MAKVLNQVCSYSTSVAASTTTNLFSFANCANGASTTEANRTIIWRSAGTFTNLYINVLTNDRAGSTLKTRIGTSNGNLSVSITGSTTGKFEDTSNSDTVSAGDDWHLQLITGAGGSVFTMGAVQLIFDATTNTRQKTGTGNNNPSFPTSGSFFGDANSGNTSVQTGLYFKNNATLRNYHVYVSANTRTSDSTFGALVNNANTSIAVAVPSGATGSFEDSSNTASVVSGDYLSRRISYTAGSNSVNAQNSNIDIETTDNTFNLVCGLSTGLTQNISVTNYFPVGGLIGANTTESVVQAEANLGFTASNIRTYISANTVSATSTARLRVNGGNGNNAASITASTTGLFEDVTNSDTITATDTINYALETGGSGTSLTVHSVAILATTTVASTSTFVPRLTLMGCG